jgi:predicted NAD/FAD-dependent oxidoreductase
MPFAASSAYEAEPDGGASPAFEAVLLAMPAPQAATLLQPHAPG